MDGKFANQVDSFIWQPRVVKILFHSHFDLVSSILIQFAIRKVAQMAPDMISTIAILCTLKEIGTQAAFLFQVTWLIKTF